MENKALVKLYKGSPNKQSSPLKQITNINKGRKKLSRKKAELQVRSIHEMGSDQFFVYSVSRLLLLFKILNILCSNPTKKWLLCNSMKQASLQSQLGMPLISFDSTLINSSDQVWLITQTNRLDHLIYLVIQRFRKIN